MEKKGLIPRWRYLIVNGENFHEISSPLPLVCL